MSNHASGSIAAAGAGGDASASSSSAPPPDYQSAVFSSKPRASIPVADRQSMELTHNGDARPLPTGWIRQHDPETGRHFYVDTKANNGEGRSTWLHPYYDEAYLKSQTPEERRRIDEENRRIAQGHAPPAGAGTRRWDDVEAETTDEESGHGHGHGHGPATGPFSQNRPPVQGHDSSKPAPKGLKKLGRAVKDKVTSSTHEERSRKRHERAAAEQRAYEQHLALRRAITTAAQTGQPQLLGKDRDGKDLIVLPPGAPAPGYGYDPWGYNPNARYLRPQEPYYGRGYGYGYGGGYGLPLAGGLLGGLLLGGLFF